MIINPRLNHKEINKRQLANDIDLSIIIVNWNAKDWLYKTLTSVYKYTKDITFEVLVIDNNSSDDSVEMIRKEFPQIRLITNKDNKGYSKANNQGIRESKGRYIILLNPDTKLLDNALKSMIEFMDNHKEAGAVGCSLLNPDMSWQSSCRGYPDLAKAFLENTLSGKLLSRTTRGREKYIELWRPEDIHEVEAVSGACLLTRREVIEQVGLLDENIFMFSEEVDWCYRIRKSGWRIYYLPYIQIIHYGGYTYRNINDKMFVKVYQTKYYFHRKHFGPLSAFIYRLLNIYGLSFRVIKWLIIYLSRKLSGQKIDGTIKPYWTEGDIKGASKQVLYLHWKALKWHLKI